jgi:hypothetical protein
MTEYLMDSDPIIAFKRSMFYASEAKHPIKIYKIDHTMDNFSSPAFIMIAAVHAEKFERDIVKITNVQKAEFVETVNPPEWN